jgi:thiol-disulfide isomerase/thioredoxin
MRLQKYGFMSSVLVLLASSTSGNASEAPAGGVAWYQGDVASAFDSARAANKPVLLYWGAKWCPPCQQLKAFVFTRSDFIEKSKQFVAVHLDGDDPSAQRWGDEFKVSGYPTVVILRADRREITRISGGNDLSVYAELLDAALHDVKPIADVLAVLLANPSALTQSDCERLANYSWSDAEFKETKRRRLATRLAEAANDCVHSSPADKARLTVNSAALLPTPETTSGVINIVHDPALAIQVVDSLEGLGDSFFATVSSKGPAAGSQFQLDWIRTMDQVANDSRVAEPDRLYAIATKVGLVKQLSADKQVPAAMAADARARASRALEEKSDPYVRAAIVNAASDIYDKLGDNDAQYALLQSEVKTAKAPYYYMIDLAELEEKRGHTTESLAWYERAYRESQGLATRFQWGSHYLAALVRLTPTDRERIRRVGNEVIAELDGPDRIQARTRMRLERLDGELRKWNANHLFDADVEALRSHMQTICTKLPSSDAGVGACKKFLS